MPLPPCLCRGARCRGFSLIELLVVMLIVGIIAGGASIGIDAARANDTELAAEHLRRALEAAAERAEVRGRPLAVDFLGDHRIHHPDVDRPRPAVDRRHVEPHVIATPDVRRVAGKKIDVRPAALDEAEMAGKRDDAP